MGNSRWGHPSAGQQVRGLKFLPVECHADPGGIWGKGHVVFNDEGALCVVLNGEGMDLDPAGVLLAGNEAHMQFLHPVATDRHTGLFGQRGHLKKAGDAAAIGGIGLDETQVTCRVAMALCRGL